MPTGASSGDAASITALADFMPAGFKDELVRAMDAWSSVADVAFVEVPDTGPNGAFMRVGGHAFVLEPRAFGHAYYPTTPGAAAGDIHFDTQDTWVIGNSGITAGGTANDPYSVMLHEIGHALFNIGHTKGAISVMNSPFTSGQFYAGLLPVDIAAAQDLYGPAPGYVAPPSTNATLTVLPSSKLNFTVTVLGAPIPMSTSVAGTIDAFVAVTAGTPAGLKFNSANLDLDNMTGSLGGIIGSVVNPQGWLFSPAVKPVALDGTFGSGDLLLGLVNGSISTTGLISTALSLYDSPLSMGTTSGGSQGLITLEPTTSPNLVDVFLTVPLENSITVDVSLLSSLFPPGVLEVTVTMDGTIDAVGTMVVPEPSSGALALFAGIALVGASRCRIARRLGN